MSGVNFVVERGIILAQGQEAVLLDILLLSKRSTRVHHWIPHPKLQEMGHLQAVQLLKQRRAGQMQLDCCQKEGNLISSPTTDRSGGL